MRRRTFGLCLGFALTLALPRSAPADSFETVQGSTGVLVCACKFQFDFDGQPADDLYDDSSFNSDGNRIVCHVAGVDSLPCFSLAQAAAFMAKPAAVALWSSHGLPAEGIAIEAYTTWEWRERAYDRYMSQYGYDDIGRAEWDDIFFITAKPAFMSTHSNLSSRSILMVAACFSDDWRLSWTSGSYIGYGYEVPSSTATSEIEQVFEWLGGAAGRENRNTGEVISGLTCTPRGNTELVISPAVLEMYPYHHTELNSDFYGAYVEFDTGIEIEGDLEDVLNSGTLSLPHVPDAIPAAQVELMSDTKITYNLRPVYSCSAVVWVDAMTIKGAGSVDRYLNGNSDPPRADGYWYGPSCRPPDRDDFVTPYISTTGDEPAAAVLVTAAYQACDGVRLEWSTSSEKDTDYFEACRSEGGEDWDVVGDPVSHTGGPFSGAHYSWFDPGGSPEHYYRLLETETDGDLVWHQVAESPFVRP